MFFRTVFSTEQRRPGPSPAGPPCAVGEAGGCGGQPGGRGPLAQGFLQSSAGNSGRTGASKSGVRRPGGRAGNRLALSTDLPVRSGHASVSLPGLAESRWIKNGVRSGPGSWPSCGRGPQPAGQKISLERLLTNQDYTSPPAGPKEPSAFNSKREQLLTKS